ncbi:uncharacterized protein LOC132253830 [Vitis vinifera]|uniref:uncharacterized protein LOC132253830 n=1 Tax=Vitis vinifera TaxID=29760 RepID=UPI0028833ACA|nr:uncharacterized protein LOC132253830 [Vitis vinifera]
MARTRGAKSSSPSSRKRVPRGEPIPDPISEPPRPKAVSPSVKPASQKPPARRYLTRSGGRPLQKRARVESSEPIDLTEQSPEPSSVPSPVPSLVPSPVPSPAPPAEPQEPQPPLPEPQIPAEIAPKEIIRRSMLTQPPIEGNLDCRAQPFHSELCFDIATFQLRPKLAQSFHLLRRYHMEHLLTPRDFFYPRVAMDFYQSITTKQVRDPTLIHFTIDGRNGILGARHIAEALQIPYEPSHFDDFRKWTSATELEMHWTQRRGVLLEALFKISEGYFFGPHHLIMAALLYFEEKLERKRICREVFTLDKWNNMTAYRVDQPERPQPTARKASPRHIPEGITIVAPAIPKAPPVTPASSQPSTLAEPRMAIPISEYRELCRSLETLTASQSSLAHEMAAIRACQEQMLATQAQHTAILRQLQHHCDLPPATEPSTSTTAVPHSHPTEPQAPSGAATEEASISSTSTTKQAQQDELPIESVPPAPAAPSMPEATSTDPPATPPVPPAAPPVPPAAPPTSEASITISTTEFRAMQHLGLLPPPQTDIPEPSEPITPAEESIPAEETTRADVPVQATHEVAIKPSSPSESPAP